ncbi:MAG: RidA family protein [Bacillota bacterium]
MGYKKELKTEKSPAAIGPYSQGIKTGNIVLTSGQIPFDNKGKLVSNDIKKQTEKVLENIRNILTEEGLDMDSVVKCTVYLEDMNDFNDINEVYRTFFNSPYPARSCVEVSALPKDVKIEIEAMAVIK